MTQIVFFSDPHMNLQRVSNTTPTSMLKLRNAITAQLSAVLREDGTMVCLGDWFDKYSNAEEALQESLPMLSRCNLVLSGNHDQHNIKGRVGSLRFLSALLAPGCVPFNDVGESKSFNYTLDGARITAIPHCSTQDLFDKALNDCYPPGQSLSGKLYKSFLLLHCNYENNFNTEDENSLNLTREKAQELLTRFDYVLLGHEHVAREEFGGRLRILGNPFPTAFTDIADKRVLIWDAATQTLESKTIWSARENAASVGYQHLEESYPVQFLRVTGTAKAAQMPAIMKACKGIWEKSPELLALKIDVEFEDLPKIEQHGDRRVKTVVEIIEESLASEPPLLNLWKELK